MKRRLCIVVLLRFIRRFHRTWDIEVVEQRHKLIALRSTLCEFFVGEFTDDPCDPLGRILIN
ncbi:hypothetical protein CNY89_02015 [Amaricoccus sp. HAR-UPW-R2A-40]|nr:hypothetical protein CNY89_02015 [Amaricoccus sp. HAR-UPW-R2A-40]